MPNDMAALLSQPSQGPPPQTEQSQPDGAQQGSLQALMRDNPGAQMQQGAQGQPAPNYEMTMAALDHLKRFERGWEGLLKLDEVGKTDIKGPFIEMMAKLMGDQYISLPQTLQMMKGFPEEPLAQRQYVEEHYKRDQQAQDALIAHHTAAFPNPNGIQPSTPPAKVNHLDMMKQVIDHYKPFQKKKSGKS